MSTARLAFGELAEGQAKKHLTINDNMYKLDVLVQTAVQDKDLTAPPGSPVEGTIYIVGSPATGAWVGKETQLAQYRNAAWSFTEPFAGLIAWINDEEVLAYWDGSSWQSGSPTAASLAGLSDVDIDTPVNGEALVYNGGVWENGTVSTVGVLDDLTDVAITTPTNGQGLVYNGASWVNGTVSAVVNLNDLTDVSISGASSGDVLTYNGTAWVNGAGGASIDLNDLNDVVITGAAKGEMLVYNGSNWVDIGVGTNGQVLTADSNYTNGVVWADASGGAMALDDLTDVQASAPSNGYALQWNSTLSAWVDAPVSVVALDDVGDVYVSSISNNQALLWDSTDSRWENKHINLGTLNDVVITTPSEGQILKYSSGNWVNGAASSGSVAALADITDVEDSPSTFEGVPYYNKWATGAVFWKHDIQLPKFMGRLRDVGMPSEYGDTNRPVVGVEGLVSDYETPSSYGSTELYYRQVDMGESTYAYGFETSNTTGGYSTSNYLGYFVEELPETGTQWYDNIGSGYVDLKERFMISITGTGAGSYWVRRVWWYEYDPSGHPGVWRCFFEIDNDNFGGNPIPALSFDTEKSVSLLGEESKVLKWHPYDMNAVPSTTTSDGRAGQIAFNTTHLYVCVADNTWRRVALSTW